FLVGWFRVRDDLTACLFVSGHESHEEVVGFVPLPARFFELAIGQCGLRGHGNPTSVSHFLVGCAFDSVSLPVRVASGLVCAETMLAQFCESCVCEISSRICLGHFFSHFPTTRHDLSGPFGPIPLMLCHSISSPYSSMIACAVYSPSLSCVSMSVFHATSAAFTISAILSRSSS